MQTSSNDNHLIDPFGRRIEYVRLSLTDKCNFRCFYCIPEGFNDFETPSHWLNFDEIEQIIRVFANLGVSRVRLTGGEPLVRKNIAQLTTRLSQLDGINDLSLSTNASLLTTQANALSNAGINRINVSLDSLKHQRFKDITGAELQPVLDGLMAAKKENLGPIKINMVAMKGINDDEFIDMINFCQEHQFTLRLIETMPMGEAGEAATDHYLDLQKVKQHIQKSINLIPDTRPNDGGPARYYRLADSEASIGFITPLSQHFCDTCNRVRLSVDGTLYLCLGQNDKVELRSYVRNGISDQELAEVIKRAIAAKPEKHDFNNPKQHVVRLMSLTGG